MVQNNNVNVMKIMVSVVIHIRLKDVNLIVMPYLVMNINILQMESIVSVKMDIITTLKQNYVTLIAQKAI
jgi:hypothetical protein